MAKAVVTKEELAALPEPLQKEYVEEDGIIHLKVDPATIKDAKGNERTYALEDVKGLRTALEKERTSAAEMKSQLAKFADIKDPEAAKKALAQIEEWQKNPPDERLAKQIEAARQHLETQYRNEINARDAKIKDSESTIKEQAETIKRQEIWHAAKEAMFQHDVLPDASDLLMTAIMDMCRCTPQVKDGRTTFLIEVLDKDGNVRISPKTGSTDRMSVGELIEELKKGRYAFCFKATQAAGSGAGGSSGKGTHTSGDLSHLPPQERMKIARQREAAAGR